MKLTIINPNGTRARMRADKIVIVRRTRWLDRAGYALILFALLYFGAHIVVAVVR